MFSRIRIAFGIALLVTVITSVTAFAKGNFAFISITSPNLKEAVRTTDPILITDFFAFADFSRDRTKAPADPGTGYEITRYYMDGSRESAFDRLHYYPDTGFVYYDGIVNGSSSYDGKWYTARPEIRMAFENALPAYARSVVPVTSSQPIPGSNRTQSITLIAAIAGLFLVLMLASRLRRPATR